MCSSDLKIWYFVLSILYILIAVKLGGAMDDINNRNKLDFQRNPLDIRNPSGVHWDDSMRKIPPLFGESLNHTEPKSNNPINSLTFMIYILLSFLGLMGLTWLYRLIHSFFIS